MAMILDKLLPVTEKRSLKLQQKYVWLRTCDQELSVVYQAKKEKKLARFVRKANHKLLPSAFAACDKQAYAQCQLDTKLQAFDVKSYMSYRAAQHKAVKAIYKAAREGREWSAYLEKMQQELKKLDCKRADVICKLKREQEKFLSANTESKALEFEEKKSQLQMQMDRLEQELDHRYKHRVDKKHLRLQAKMDAMRKRLTSGKKHQDPSLALEEDVVLSIRGLKMYFGGLKAVDDLSFNVKSGEIFGLIGPNGAGKTTVFNCITQFYKPTDGQLLLRTRNGDVIHLTDYQVHDIVLKGIARTFQNVEVVKEVSVLDNLLIAATRQYTSSLFTQMFHLPKLGREERIIRAKADRILKYMDLAAYRDRLCWGLPYGVLKRVEIARSLMCDPQLIILDEPAAGLNESETRELADRINRIRQDFNCTILLVEHDMSLVMNICDHICAISFGKKLAEGTPAQIQSSKAVQEAYLGTGGT